MVVASARTQSVPTIVSPQITGRISGGVVIVRVHIEEYRQLGKPVNYYLNVLKLAQEFGFNHHLRETVFLVEL